MNSWVLLACLAAAVGVAVCDDVTCSSTCSEYTTCSILNINTTANQTSNITLTDSLVCNSEVDAGLGYLFTNMSSCSLKNAAIELSLLLSIEWDAVSAIEAVFDDEEFWLPGCEWPHLGAALCLYSSLPETGSTCTGGDAALTRASMFCPGECMELANSCFNLAKYRNLKDSFTSGCKGMTATAATDSCFKGQVHQDGVTAPVCKAADVAATSLTGPYVLAGIALALAIVALIGLALITVRNGGAGGGPNSF